MGVQGSVVQQNKNQMGSTLKNFQKVNTELGSISAVAFIYNFNALLNLIQLLDLETRVNGLAPCARLPRGMLFSKFRL